MKEWAPLPSARAAILEQLPQDTSLHGEGPKPKFVHVPASHAKALDPDVQVVSGMRGAGKSFWWAALQDPNLRALLARSDRQLEALQNARVSVGFGERSSHAHYPGRDTLAQLLKEGAQPRMVWRTVVLRAFGLPMPDTEEPTWKDHLAYVETRPEEVERFLDERDRQSFEDDRYELVLFDALDRSASDWSTMHRLVRGLLELALELRPYRRLRIKCFLRTDQLDERQVADFPDASKVLSGMLELSWPHHELYAMFFQYLGNDDRFRREVKENFRLEWRQVDDEIWRPPEALTREGGLQREIFHAITGPWMGRDRRRGYPYSWVPGHLADAYGRTSPRSFLAALRKAAQDTRDRYPQHTYPLHYESIKRGVQEASRIRRAELREDYPWVDTLMEPLDGMTVPCDFPEIAARWEQAGLPNRLRQEEQRLPPAHLAEGYAGLRRDLEDLGIFLRTKDDRVNIPDVFRVAYGLGRKGGVKPLRRGSG